jgi:TonB family protein
MKNRLAVALFVLFSILTFAPNPALAQDSSEISRKVVARVAPQYPNIARSMNIQGNVRADVLVAANGTAKSIEVKGGHPLLGQSAQDALRQWKWEPASHETHEIVELKFKL